MDEKKNLGAADKQISDEDRLELLRQILEREQQRKEVENENVIEELRKGLLPTAPENRQIINMRVGDERLRLMSNHTYWTEKKLREGLDALVSTAHNAVVDICRHEAALTSFSQDRKGFDEHVQYTVSNPFQKDVMAFCAAALGIIGTTRRIKKRRPELTETIESIIEGLFRDDITKFIKDLRKNLSHGSVIVPGWVITSDQGGVSGAMTFATDELLMFGDWSVGSKRYIKSAPDKRISVRHVVAEYHGKIQNFAKQMSNLFARNVSSAESDYYDIEDEHKRIGKRQFAKILVSQVGKGRNPYEYLHLFFTPEEVREILRRPNNSKEQVNFIISIKVIDTDCDDQLRNELYDLFGVVIS